MLLTVSLLLPLILNVNTQMGDELKHQYDRSGIFRDVAHISQRPLKKASPWNSFSLASCLVTLSLSVQSKSSSFLMSIQHVHTESTERVSAYS